MAPPAYRDLTDEERQEQEHMNDAQSERSSFDDWLEDQEMEMGASVVSLGNLSTASGGARVVSGGVQSSGSGAREREKKVRKVMLACACCLSIGSHYGSYVLGPTKTKMKGSESNFASLISASQLVNTVTPLVVGSLVPKYGVEKCGLAATGVVLLGQLIVCWSQRNGPESESVNEMVLGLLIFGLGIAPLAVVQEAIVIGAKRKGSKSVGRSVAAALVFGKTASFLASATAEPLASVNERLPFITAATLSLFSFSACLLYAYLANSIEDRSDDAETLEHIRKHKRIVGPSEVSTFGDPFFLYLLVCVLAGTWYTQIHLSPSLLETIFDMSDLQSAEIASVIPFASIFTYPLVGWAVDKNPPILRHLLLAVPMLMGITWILILLFSSLLPALVAIIPLALGNGPAPLLVVLVVSRIVSAHHLPTALGLHKSAEMAGAVLFQALAASLLSSSTPKSGSFRVVLQFLATAASQLGAVVLLWRCVARREASVIAYAPIDEEVQRIEEEPQVEVRGSRSDRETGRGVVAIRVFAGLIAVAWTVFLVNWLGKG
ncbi:major facilitator superfamily protein [Pseudohyphozyma bogoriensis]|nr:major facilitator superfamily protein [Pseudohyphozyma bogoriensis]